MKDRRAPQGAASFLSYDPERKCLLAEDGAKRFGWNWIHANCKAIRVLRESGLDPEKNAALGMAIATAICEGVEQVS